MLIRGLQRDESRMSARDCLHNTACLQSQLRARVNPDRPTRIESAKNRMPRDSVIVDEALRNNLFRENPLKRAHPDDPALR